MFTVSIAVVGVADLMTSVVLRCFLPMRIFLTYTVK